MGLGFSILNFILSGGKIIMCWFDDDDDEDVISFKWDDDDYAEWGGYDNDEEREDFWDSESTDTD